MNANIDKTIRNDAIAEVECGRQPNCCLNPHWINQFGSKECMCHNCGLKCRKCSEDWMK